MTSKILVLDDEENYTRMLQDLLEQNRFVVETATMPIQAIKRLEQEHFDLVVSDYKMPVMDGAAFLKRAREIHPDLPVIVVSGLMNTPELVKVANMSVTLVLEKPLNTAEFLRQVRRFAKPKGIEETSPDAGELAESAIEGSARTAKQGVFTYPDPLFFSATCLASKNVLQELWQQVSEQVKTLTLHQSEGGDAELLVKEIAFWKGEGKPLAVHFFKLSKLLDGDGLKNLEDVILDRDASPVVGIHTPFQDQAVDIEVLVSTVAERPGERATSEHFLPVFIVSEPRGQLPGIGGSLMNQFAAGSVITVPPLASRASDIAAYIRQVAKAELDDEVKGALTFSPEAAFSMLIYEWPGNYSELCSVVRMLVKRTGSGPVTLDVVMSIFEERIEFSAAIASATRTERLALYLRQRQSLFIRHLISQEGMSVERIVEFLGLAPDTISSEEDLLDSPLIEPDLARLT